MKNVGFIVRNCDVSSYAWGNVCDTDSNNVFDNVMTNVRRNVTMIVKRSVWNNVVTAMRNKSLTHKQLQSAFSNLEKL